MDRGRGQREKSPVRELMGKKGAARREGRDTTEIDRELDKYRDESGKIPELSEQGHRIADNLGRDEQGRFLSK